MVDCFIGPPYVVKLTAALVYESEGITWADPDVNEKRGAGKAPLKTSQ
jgi:hypothetical protein